MAQVPSNRRSLRRFRTILKCSEDAGMDDLPCVLMERILSSSQLSKNSDKKNLRLVCRRFEEFINATITSLTALPGSKALNCPRAGKRFPALTTVRLEQLTQSAGMQTIANFLLPSSHSGLRVQCVSTGGFKGRWGRQNPDTEYLQACNYESLTPLQHVTRFELHVGPVALLRECPPIPFCMSALSRLAELYISERVSYALHDHDLQELPRIQQLTRLEIEGRDITYGGVLHIKCLHLLQVLSLRNCASIENTAVSMLQAIQGLRCLDLGGTQVGSAGVKALTNLPKLQVLGLHHTAVGKSGLIALFSFPSLEMVGLNADARATLHDSLDEWQGRPIPSIRVARVHEFLRSWMI